MNVGNVTPPMNNSWNNDVGDEDMDSLLRTTNFPVVSPMLGCIDNTRISHIYNGLQPLLHTQSTHNNMHAIPTQSLADDDSSSDFDLESLLNLDLSPKRFESAGNGGPYEYGNGAGYPYGQYLPQGLATSQGVLHEQVSSIGEFIAEATVESLYENESNDTLTQACQMSNIIAPAPVNDTFYGSSSTLPKMLKREVKEEGKEKVKRKYNKKTEEIKNCPVEREKRKRNNQAVQKWRENHKNGNDGGNSCTNKKCMDKFKKLITENRELKRENKELNRRLTENKLAKIMKAEK